MKNENITIYYENNVSCSGLGPPPMRLTEGSTGYDLRSSEDLSILPGEFKLVKTGLKFRSIPENIDVQIRSRSGLALKYGIFVLNGPGTVDSDYKGEICVILANFGKSTFDITRGDRIAQMVFAQVIHPNFLFNSDLTLEEVSSRGEKGFGSTGI